MARRFLAIVLAIAVGLANAACACAEGPVRPSPAAGANAAMPCHAPLPAEVADAAACCSAGDTGEQNSHDCCGHCSGTTAVEAAPGQIVIPTAVPAPLLVIEVDPYEFRRDSQSPVRRLAHAGLSPPATTATLLSLCCSLQL